MFTQQLRQIALRIGMLALAVFLIACSAGLGYVVHLTRQTVAQRGEASQPSLLPLIVLALMAAIGGLATLRVAFHRSRSGELSRVEI